MRLNHLNLCVTDLDEAAAFFARHFGLMETARKGELIVVLDDGEGFTLVLSDPTKFGGEDAGYPEGFHVGFLVATAAEVDATHARLRAEGVQIDGAPHSMRGT